MERSDYKQLGQFIEPVMEKNANLSVKLSQGINNKKYFQNPRQVSENSANDQIVRKGQFAYNKATTRNGEKISIAYREGPDCTVSSAYQVFRIKDEEQLNPHYLLLWFKRPEFDRYARFKSHGSAHEFFDWEEMCKVTLPVPPIEEQRRIVEEYQTVERRIKNNEALIQKLEETAQAIYHHTFVEGIDDNNLPEGWKMGRFSDVMLISSGKSAIDKSDVATGDMKYPVAGAAGIIGYSSHYNCDKPILTTGRVGTLGIVNKYEQPIWCADNVLVIESEYYNYSYLLLKRVNYNEIAKGGVQALLTQTELNGCSALIPPSQLLSNFESNVKPIYDYADTILHELHNLRALQSLLTSKLT